MKKKRRLTWLGGTVVLLAIGIVVGLLLQNVWLGVALAAFASVVWLIAVESRNAGNQGVNDQSHGIEL